MSRDLWVFGYGSLVWRPGMAVLEGMPAAVTGWRRRFWQGSPDHRGTPTAPGRVVTLIDAPGVPCHGQAWRVGPDVLGPLAHREQAGYLQLEQPCTLADGRLVSALVYVALVGNPDWLGPAPLAEMAAQIQRCVGPSGTNREYLLRLAETLSDRGVRDAHVEALASAVLALP